MPVVNSDLPHFCQCIHAKSIRDVLANSLGISFNLCPFDNYQSGLLEAAL